MTYISNADIEERLGSQAYVQLADDDGDGVADAGVVDEARFGAEGEVNSYLARRFQVPIDSAGNPELAGVLKSIALDLAEYRLRMRRPPVPADSVRRRSEAIVWLRGISEGRLELPSITGAAASAAQGPPAWTGGAERILSRDELSDH